MSRRPKGPRLYFRAGRLHPRTGKPIVDVWVIRDGAREVSTGCGLEELSGPGGAEEQLANYILKKQQAADAPAPASPRDPAEVLVAEALALYAAERGPALGLSAKTLEGFVRQLCDWWGVRTLADVKRSTCKAYVKHRTSMPHGSYKDPATAPRVSSETARRELETLSGAITYWDGEHKLASRPSVWLPEKPESTREALSRSQAAALLWAAMGWRRDPETGKWTRNRTSKANRMHVRRFVLIGLYTGPRHNVMRALLWEESATHPWADLDRRLIYRRGREEVDKPTKRRPVVKIPRRLAAHMRRWRRLDLALEARLQEERPGYRVLSVLHYAGAPLAGKIRSGFEGCVRDAGLPEDVTPHWMRHTAATWLMEANADLWAASQFLGMSPATLLKHYGHLRPDYQADEADKITQKRGVSGDHSGDQRRA